MKNLRNLVPALLIVFMLPSLNGQKIKSNAVVANWYIEPLENVAVEEFTNFILSEYIPELKNTFPGVGFYLLKSDRGRDEGSYCILAIFDSVDERNEWWPEEGESSEKAKAAMKKMDKLSKKFDALAKMPAWNDWIVQ